MLPKSLLLMLLIFNVDCRLSMAHLKMCLCKKVTDLSQFLIAGERSHSTQHINPSHLQSYKKYTHSKQQKTETSYHVFFPFLCAVYVLLKIFPFLSSVDACRSYFKFILKCIRRSTFRLYTIRATHTTTQNVRKIFILNTVTAVYIRAASTAATIPFFTHPHFHFSFLFGIIINIHFL